jgi:hypothetical protein
MGHRRNNSYNLSILPIVALPSIQYDFHRLRGVYIIRSFVSRNQQNFPWIYR